MLTVLAAAPSAGAHVQVLPATVAPGDTVLFTVLVPNEADQATVQVDLQIPDGVIPFSFEEAPGWTRTETRALDESIDAVSWKGTLPAGEFVRFFFLASTPREEGSIAWPAAERSADGTMVRWVGPAGSATPAALTLVSAGAPRQDAGGEGAGETATAPAETSASASETVAAPAGSSKGGSDVVAIVAIAVGAVLGVFGLWTLWNIRRKRAG